jgi:hypothetical protein
LSKKRCGIQTFFSTTVQPFMPQFRISEHYYGKRYNWKAALNPFLMGMKQKVFDLRRRDDPEIIPACAALQSLKARQGLPGVGL